MAFTVQNHEFMVKEASVSDVFRLLGF